MIKGSHWPIPKTALMDGAIFSLKNADRLNNDSQKLLQEKRYASALSLGTLALEEFGKHCMLMDVEERNYSSIDAKTWNQEFENHTKKLLAIPRRLRKFSERNDSTYRHQMTRLENYLTKLSKMKLESIYVDWDGKNNRWFYFENNWHDLEYRTKQVVKTGHWVIEKYIEMLGGDRDLIFTLPKELVSLLMARKTHCFCPKCGSVIFNRMEFLSHNNLCGHTVQWFWN